MTMPDLDERVRAIESAPPPDLWPEILARAVEEGPDRPFDDSVVALPPGPGWRRRAATVAVAAAVFALAAIPLWRTLRPAPPTAPVPAALPEGWDRCTNDAVGYSIGYPGDWFTTDALNGQRSAAFACRWFATEPFGAAGNEVLDGYGYPLEVSVRDARLDDVVSEMTGEGVKVISSEVVDVEGHRAVHLEIEFRDSPLVDAGSRLYAYVVELQPKRTVSVLTFDPPGGPDGYNEDRRIVDLAVGTLQFADLHGSNDP
jgi:hypothetical protein